MPVRKNAGGPPIGPLTAPKAKNEANFCAVDDALPVAAEDREAVDREAAHQHADVLRRVAAAELAQARLASESPPCRR